MIEQDDAYGYGYGYGYGGYPVGPGGAARGWAQGYQPTVGGYVAGSTIACTNWANQYCQEAQRQICALDSASPLCTSYSCAQLQQAIQNDCTLFVWQNAADLGSQIGFCARCVNGTWTSRCAQPAGTTCSPSGGGGCTSDAQCPQGCSCVSGSCQCPAGTGGQTVLLLGAVGGAVALALLFALSGPSRKTITVSG